MARNWGVDLETAVRPPLVTTAAKYSVEMAKGVAIV